MCPYKIKLPCIKALMPWFSSKTPMAAFGSSPKSAPFCHTPPLLLSHTICRKKRGESDKPDWTYLWCNIWGHLLAIGSNTWKGPRFNQELLRLKVWSWFFLPQIHTVSADLLHPLHKWLIRHAPWSNICEIFVGQPFAATTLRVTFWSFCVELPATNTATIQ